MGEVGFHNTGYNYFKCCGLRIVVKRYTSYIIIIIDRFYVALFSALEQTDCARM